MRIFVKFAETMANIARVIVEVAIILIMLLTVADVVMRYTIKVGIMGVTEYSQMIMAVILLATASTAMGDNHIKVDILFNHLGRTKKNISLLISNICSVIISGLIASRTFYEVARAMRDHITYLTLGWPQWPFFLLFGIAMLILCISALALTIKLITDWKKQSGEGEESDG